MRRARGSPLRRAAPARARALVRPRFTGMRRDPDVDRLAARAQEGDPQAFEALVRRLVRPALAAAWEFVPTREDAEDIVQDAFARAWRQLVRYDAARPFAPWFFTILRNVARNARRFDRRWRVVSLTDEVVGDEPESMAEEEPEAPSVLDRIHATLDELPPMQRACFRLTAIEGFASAEAGQMLGVSDATVRVHAHRARKALRARLGARPGAERS
jgi:RNA polymerase sigma-70 factor (ECF subfamily)